MTRKPRIMLDPSFHDAATVAPRPRRSRAALVDRLSVLHKAVHGTWPADHHLSRWWGSTRSALAQGLRTYEARAREMRGLAKSRRTRKTTIAGHSGEAFVPERSDADRRPGNVLVL